MKRGIIAITFRCRIHSGGLTPNPEATDFAWLTPTEVKTHMNEAFAARLLDAQENEPVPVRNHDGVNLIHPP